MATAVALKPRRCIWNVPGVDIGKIVDIGVIIYDILNITVLNGQVDILGVIWIVRFSDNIL